MKTKIGLISLGCAKNLVDSELMLGMLGNEYEITNNEAEAQVIIVNTCGFIERAKQESINAILEMAEYKNKNCKGLVVTGCLAERYQDEIFKEMPEVDAVIGTGNYSDIVIALKKVIEGEHYSNYKALQNLKYLDNERIITTGKGFAYLKIAEGCDNCCTYCIIPSLRGQYRSRNMESIIKEAKVLSNGGYKEIILIAQDTTRYGIDIYGKKMLATLIRELSRIENIKWIRILYCYPEAIDDELLEEVAVNQKVCKYLDIPIQHIDNNILKKMGRRTNKEDILTLIRKIRNKIPDVILRTSLIVGFPGEDHEQFESLLEFVNNIKFDRLGVFKYSREENTPAAKLSNQVSDKLKTDRYNKLMELQQKVVFEKNLNRLNKVYTSIVDGVCDDGIFYLGRTYAESPDVDSKVYFTSPKPLCKGDFVDVKILNTDEYDLIGGVVDEFTQ